MMCVSRLGSSFWTHDLSVLSAFLPSLALTISLPPVRTELFQASTSILVATVHLQAAEANVGEAAGNVH